MTDELLGLLDAAWREDDEATYWPLIRVLQKRVPEELDRIVALTRDLSVETRGYGVAILTQGGDLPADSLVAFAPAICAAVFREMLERDADPVVISHCLFGLAKMDLPYFLTIMDRYARHENPRTSYSLTTFLGGLQHEPGVVELLLVITKDPDEWTRNWAVFSLAILDRKNSPAIRDALLACVEDSYPGTRWEAMHGLVLRGETRVIPALRRAIEEASRPGQELADYEFGIAREALAACRELARAGHREWEPIAPYAEELGVPFATWDES